MTATLKRLWYVVILRGRFVVFHCVPPHCVPQSSIHAISEFVQNCYGSCTINYTQCDGDSLQWETYITDVGCVRMSRSYICSLHICTRIESQLAFYYCTDVCACGYQMHGGRSSVIVSQNGHTFCFSVWKPCCFCLFLMTTLFQLVHVLTIIGAVSVNTHLERCYKLFYYELLLLLLLFSICFEMAKLQMVH